MINLLWNFSEKQNSNKTANLQAKTYFPLQNIVNMILTRRANYVLGMQLVTNSLAVRNYFVSKSSILKVKFLVHRKYAILSEVPRLITEL